MKYQKSFRSWYACMNGHVLQEKKTINIFMLQLILVAIREIHEIDLNKQIKMENLVAMVVLVEIPDQYIIHDSSFSKGEQD